MALVLLVRRKKTTIYLHADESDTVLEIKRMISAILKCPPQNQQLFHVIEADDDAMTDSHVQLDDPSTLASYAITRKDAKAIAESTVIGLAIADDSGSFEPLEITPYTSPKPLNLQFPNFTSDDEIDMESLSIE